MKKYFTEKKYDVRDIVVDLTGEYKSLMYVYDDEVNYEDEFISRVCSQINHLLDEIKNDFESDFVQVEQIKYVYDKMIKQSETN